MSKASLNMISLPEIEVSSGFDGYILQEKEGALEWSSPDGKIKLQYSNNWMDITQIAESSAKEAGISFPDSEVLLLAQRLDIQSQGVAFLIVLKFSNKETLESILVKIEKEALENNGEAITNIVSSDESYAVLETTSEYPEVATSYSKSEVLFGKDKTYMVTFSVPTKDGGLYTQEIEEIFNSIIFQDY